MRCTVDISISQWCAGKIPFSAQEIRDILKRMASAAKEHIQRTHLELECLIVSDHKMERMNAENFGLPGPTNILAFPTAPALAANNHYGKHNKACRTQPFFLGSLALNTDALQRETFLYKQTSQALCLALLAHGFAHLCGFDHGTAMTQLCTQLEHYALQKIPC